MTIDKMYKALYFVDCDYINATKRGQKQLRTLLLADAMAIHEPSFNLLTNAKFGSELGEMAAKVATRNFDLNYTTFVFFNSTLWCGVQMFLNSFNYDVILNAGAFTPKFADKIHQCVLFGMEVTDIEQTLDLMQQHGMDNTGKFIIICQSNKQKECDEADAVKLFWERNIINVIFIKTESALATAYTYYPVTEMNCNNLKPIKLNRSHCSNDVSSICDDMYDAKLKNLYSCPLIVSTFIQTPYMNITNGIPVGTDGDLLRIIGDILNARLTIMFPHRGQGWGWRDDDGTWMGSLADIQEGLANVSMTSAALTLARSSDFQISDSYKIVSVGWVTHPAIQQPAALKLFYPFKRGARLALSSSFIVVIFFAFVLRTNAMTSIFKRIQVAQPTKSLVFHAWMICMGQAISKFPSKAVLLQMTLLWIFYCFLIRNAYQGSLISSLKGKFYEDQFETVDEAIVANYPFGGGRALKDYYIDYPTVYENWIDVEASELLPLFRNISNGMKFVLAMNLDAAKFYHEEYKMRVHILPQRVALSPTSIYFKRHSALVKYINVILGRLSASGLTDKFYEKYSTVIQSDQSVGGEEVINMHHLTACYVMLIVGWIVSIFSFLLEIYFGKI